MKPERSHAAHIVGILSLLNYAEQSIDTSRMRGHPMNSEEKSSYLLLNDQEDFYRFLTNAESFEPLLPD